MKKIYPFVAGKTLESHTTFLKKLTKRGAKEVKTSQESDVTIVFCPIVTRFETDIESALSSLDSGCQKVILVAMHHTFDKDYTLPRHREIDERKGILLFVDCLFFEKEGLLTCRRNKEAVKMVCQKLGLRKLPFGGLKLKLQSHSRK